MSINVSQEGELELLPNPSFMCSIFWL